MNQRQRPARRADLAWPAAWAVGTTTLVAVLPQAARGRLPGRLATHWGGGGANGSLPLWAACAVPALIWAVLAGAALLGLRRDDPAARAWSLSGLLAGGVLFGGLQATTVRANLDRTDWHGAGLPLGWFLGTLAAAVLAGLAGRLLGGRGAAPDRTPPPAGPVLQLPDGERLVWFSRTVNPWLRALAAGSGLVALAALLALVGGLAGAGTGWALAAPFALVSLATAACSSVQARVSEAGLEVALGPVGRPARRWSLADLESARVEHRTAARVGGWGYRLSGLGTTVMLRGGECLVVRDRAGRDFAVSLDDAERGAALLNALRAARAR